MSDDLDFSQAPQARRRRREPSCGRLLLVCMVGGIIIAMFGGAALLVWQINREKEAKATRQKIETKSREQGRPTLSVLDQLRVFNAYCAMVRAGNEADYLSRVAPETPGMFDRSTIQGERAFREDQSRLPLANARNRAEARAEAARKSDRELAPIEEAFRRDPEKAAQWIIETEMAKRINR